jgi:uncharacterized protein with GYD domain
MARVFMLVGVLPGKEKRVREMLRAIPGVVIADFITGQFDLAAVIEGTDTADIFGRILGEIRKVKGITRTETFVALE